MTYVIVGLGNPGDEYEYTRHNTGRIVLEHLREMYDFDDWKKDKTANALVAKGDVDGARVTLVMPETFMNKSGSAVVKFVKNTKQAERLVVVYDDLDLPFGTCRMAFDRGSGGHKGIESITRSLKTKAFIRIRVGITPATPSGKLKKPLGEKKVLDFIMKDFTPKEKTALKKTAEHVVEALDVLFADGRQKATGVCNS